MNFKYPEMLKQYDIIPDKLKMICLDFDALSKENNIIATITRISDPVKGDSGVHEVYRGIDFRNQYFDGKSFRCLYSVEVVDEILHVINDKYKRDDGLLTIIHHSFENGPFHFHVQIPYKDMTAIDIARIANAPK